MARVIAKTDVLTDGGMRVAKAGDQGRALRNHMPKRGRNLRRVAVQWGGRRKVYWALLGELEFVDPALDPYAYLALPTRMPEIEFPPLPKPPDPYEFNFGANLKHYRDLRKLYQWKLAELLNDHGVPVAQTTISHWEQSEESPAGIYVRALARVMQVPVFAFFLNLRDCRWIVATKEYMIRVEDTLCTEEPL